MKQFAEYSVNGLTPSAPVDNPWRANLSLGFAYDGGTTRLMERSHFGPLRVQKPLYPEGPEVCHTIVVHPPGGVVGGDELAITARVDAHARAFVTTPGAAKWYKANGRVSRQNIQLEVASDASLEWMPQETIFFDAADVQLSNAIGLGIGATYIGFEILCFGRTASGETFRSGKVTQRNVIRRDEKLIWFEQGAVLGGSSSMTSPLALAGNTVCATVIAVGKSIPPALVNSIRGESVGLTRQAGAFGVTQSKSLLVARYMGNSSEVAKQWAIQVWQQLRPAMLGRPGVAPRIWNT